MTKYVYAICTINTLLFVICQALSAASDKATPADGLAILQPFLTNQELFEQKIRAFDKLHVGLARASYVKARSLEQEGKQTEAKAASEEEQNYLKLVKAAYEMGLAHFDNSALLHNFYGELIHDFFGQVSEAAQHWKRATQLDPEFARAHCNFGMYAFHNGMYSIGLDSMDTALRLEPDNPDFLYNMTQVYLVHSLQIMQIRKWDSTRTYNEAMKMSEKAARLLPEDYEVLRDYALNFFRGEDFNVHVNWKDAAKAWQTVRLKARTDAEIFNAWLNEARVHKSNNDKKQAMKCLDSAQAVWPDSPVVKQLIEDFRE